VRANGRYVAACHTPVTDGMRVDNDTPELNADRRRIVEMLLVSGQHVCPACERSGSCELQALAYRLGVLAPTLPPMPANEAVDASHPDLFLDRNRCILCTRCVRSVRVLDGKTSLGLEGRGLALRLAVNSPDGLGGTDLTASDHAARACPVGSLVLKRTGFRVPYGERLYDRTPIGADIDAAAAAPGEEA
jgi:[NiFe] hydrogenase diaphorase moiety small subunit